MPRFTALKQDQDIIVVHVLPGLSFGGIERLCYELIKQSSPSLKHVLIVYRPEQTGMLDLFLQLPNLEIINCQLAGKSRLQFIASLTEILKSITPQAVITYAFGTHTSVAVAARLARIPTVVTHGGNPPPADEKARKKWKRLILLSRLLNVPIIYCSEYVKIQFESLTKAPRGSTVIHHGCDVEAIARRTSEIKATSPHHTRLVIGMVARLNKIKDHGTLIRSMAKISKTYNEVELWLVGEGDQRPDLTNLATKLNITDKVVFWGNRSDVPDLLAQMDIYAFSTTEDEGFGIAIIEAMAAGLPIIASDVAACREVLNNGEVGILVQPGNSDELAIAIEQMVRSEMQRTLLGNQAYRYALRHYTIKKSAEKWYTTILNHG